jgi:hypothetical protein
MLDTVYTILDEHGFVSQAMITGQAPEGAVIAPQSVATFHELYEHGYYVQDDAWHVVGPRPDKHHVLDKVAKSWVVDLEGTKDEHWRALKTARTAFESGGFEWDGSLFDSDQRSQSRIQGAVQLAMLAQAQGQAFEIDWTLADDTVRTLNAADVLAVGGALAAHVMNAHAIGRAARAAVTAATSVESVLAVAYQ